MGNVKTATSTDLQWGSRNNDDTTRLDQLLTANAEIAKRRAIFRSDRDEFEAAAMKRPLTAEKAFAYLGFTLGSLGPFSIFLKLVINANGFDPGFGLAIGLFLIANTATAAMGFWTGKVIGRAIVSLRSRSWPTFIALSLLLGVAWGAISGGFGGFFLFIIADFLAQLSEQWRAESFYRYLR